MALIIINHQQAPVPTINLQSLTSSSLSTISNHHLLQVGYNHQPRVCRLINYEQPLFYHQPLATINHQFLLQHVLQSLGWLMVKSPGTPCFNHDFPGRFSHPIAIETATVPPVHRGFLQIFPAIETAKVLELLKELMVKLEKEHEDKQVHRSVRTSLAAELCGGGKCCLLW